MNYFTRDFTNSKLFVCSSQEPDAKRQRVDDGSSGAAGTMADAQANNSAYNYNWYQVGFSSEQLMAQFLLCHTKNEWPFIAFIMCISQ